MLGWFRLPRYELLTESDRITLADNRVRVEVVFALRPHVRVYGASVLRPLFEGDEQKFLRDALVHAGATTVDFAVSA
jgi:hypothetical protein